MSSASSSSQVPGTVGGDPASSLSQQTQPLRAMPPSLSANVAAQKQAPSPSSFSPTTTLPTQEQPPHQPQLFPKPHRTFPPTHATNTPAIATATTSSLPATLPLSKSPIAAAALAVLSTTASTSASPTASLSTTIPTTHVIPQNPAVVAATSVTHTVNPHFVKGDGVTEPLPTDVICGRGKMTASHPANRRFRELVDAHKAAYQNSKRRDEKTRITCELVDKLRAEGRFVLFDPHTKLWHEVSEEYAREKVSHSLRSRSSHEQKIATAASNSIKMLNNAVQHPSPSHQDKSNSTTTNENNSNNNTTMVTIAPRTAQGTQGSSKSQPLALTPQSSKQLAQGPSTLTHHTPTATTKSTKPKSSHSKSSKTSASPRKKSTGSSPKTTPSGHKTTRAKHLKPGLDEIVQRLIKDQQSLLRAMIQKETERFTSAAAMSGVSSTVSGASSGGTGSNGATRAMPLSYKAEASAVNKLTASLPKMGKPLTEASRMVTAEVEANSGGHTPAAAPPTTTTPATAATTTANA